MAPQQDQRVPVSTYRFQISADFTLADATERLGYLHDLGVDWVYLSPLLAAEPGSDHGYDVVAHDRIDESRGGAAGLAALSAQARRLGLGVLVDIVPNHVGVATPTPGQWWWDLLQHGRSSAYVDSFDVDWDAGDGRLLVPIVGDDDEAAIRVTLSSAGGEVRYHDHRFPMAPGTSTLAEQHYRLVSWRQADAGLNYRRFFAINTLAAVRVEDRDVFDASHVEVRRWFEEGLVDGLRVDHPDGLRDPEGYLEDLAALTGGAYVLVEKILEPGEVLLDTWATAGTTGYDALALVDRVLTDPAGQAPLGALETRLRGAEVDWHQLIHDTKRAVADTILHSEVLRITRELAATGAPGLDDEVADEVADAVGELLACFGVYRSYLPQGARYLDAALADARAHRPDLARMLDLLAPVLGDPDADPALRFQQTSGMVMAKGVEDCAFYRYSRLTSLNEVGGDPSIFSVTPAQFHAAMADRQADWPHAMTCLSTHDTKRGEDVRARITVLAETPEAWETTLDRLLELAPVPDPGFGSLLWQAVLGAWGSSPDETLRTRLQAYAEKAMREAGDHTTWTEPDADYENAVHAAVDAAFDDTEVRAVLDGLVDLVGDAGWANALGAKLVAITMPGVPDVYQGSELWEQSLVDPDNRRPVDFDVRASLLGTPPGPGAPTGVEDVGAAKLHVTAAALRLRRDAAELFTTYAPVAATGPAAAHVLAFDRGGAITVATRLPLTLAGTGWGDTTLTLPPGTWRDVLTDRVVTERLDDVLATLPVALLVKDS